MTDDFNLAVPDVSLPANFSSTPQTVPQLGSVLGGLFSGFTYVLNGGDWKLGPVNLNNGGIYVQGNVRLWIDGDFKMTSTASVTLAPGATVEIYIGHPTSTSGVQMDLSGNCVINPTGIPANCAIFGFPNCYSMKYAGNAAAYCRLYAPSADIRITGDYDFHGSIVGNYVRFSGNAQIHYDEALGGDSATYTVVRWQEL